MITQMKYHRQEVGIMVSEKDTIESMLNMKIEDVRKTIKNEENRYFMSLSNGVGFEERWTERRKIRGQRVTS